MNFYVVREEMVHDQDLPTVDRSKSIALRGLTISVSLSDEGKCRQDAKTKKGQRHSVG